MTDPNLLARILELIQQRDQAWATKNMYKELYNNAYRDCAAYRSLYEAQQRLHLADIMRARSAGQGQALRALLKEIDWVRVNVEDPTLDHLEGWARDTLEELGEEPREERTR